MQHIEEAVPKWLDNSFLRKALRSYRRDDTIEVLSFNMKTGFSEHFASTMFQSAIVFESSKYPQPEPETLNVVIKTKPVNEGYKMEVVSRSPMFETEIKMYQETIPAFQQLFERSGLKIDLAPELIYTTDEPFPIIILKDLTQDGFFSPRDPPDEFDDSKLIIQKLAQFHAASYYLTETNEKDFSDFTHSMYQNPGVIEGFFKETFEIFKEVLETWDGFEHFIPKIDNLMKNIGEIGIKCYTANKPGMGFNVLNHGDFHVRNLLVKNGADNRLQTFYLIDHQLSVYCSPAVDLTYSMGMVKRDAEGDLPTEEIIMFYHEEFVKTLKSFGFMKSPPTLLDVNVELLRHGTINCINTICFIPYIFADWSKMSVEDTMGNDSERAKSFKKSLYDHPVCQKLIKREMNSWLHKGWL